MAIKMDTTHLGISIPNAYFVIGFYRVEYQETVTEGEVSTRMFKLKFKLNTFTDSSLDNFIESKFYILPDDVPESECNEDDIETYILTLDDFSTGVKV